MLKITSMKYLALFTLLVLASCSKTDSVDPKTLEPFKELSATIDGEDWVAAMYVKFRLYQPKWAQISGEDGKSPAPNKLTIHVKGYDSLVNRSYELRYPGTRGDSSYIELVKNGKHWQSIDGYFHILSNGDVIIAQFSCRMTQRDNPTDTFAITDGKLKITK